MIYDAIYGHVSVSNHHSDEWTIVRAMEKLGLTVRQRIEILEKHLVHISEETYNLEHLTRRELKEIAKLGVEMTTNFHDKTITLTVSEIGSIGFSKLQQVKARQHGKELVGADDPMLDIVVTGKDNLERTIEWLAKNKISQR